MIRIHCMPTRGKYLKPGDLFSTAGPDYWTDENRMGRGIGERVYIRTNTPVEMAPDADELIYKITIEHLPSAPTTTEPIP